MFGFLPLTLLIYYLSPRHLRNAILLSASLLFYAWGEVFYIILMIFSIISNYVIGRLIASAQETKSNSRSALVVHTLPIISSPKIYLAIGVTINIGLLVTFKYANFIVDNVNALLLAFGMGPMDLAPVHLPLGISFFTFQALSYIVDVYRNQARVQKNVYELALYISLFPQLIAGPIVRYHDISQQLTNRVHSTELFSSGVQRFIIGLAKKMLIANPLGETADLVFGLSGSDLTMPLAWIGILAYTLQIFFDFSGYSDMAIGLGRMFGFRFLENFNLPYISKSLREFWRRWHISLSTWFRDYVYISMGGSYVSNLKVYRNLLIVFLLTGVWHGASWNFIVWGLFHGFFLASEHAGFSRVLDKTWKPVRHLYVLSVVIASWVFFRADTLGQAMDYFVAMANLDNWHTTKLQYAQVTSEETKYVFYFGVLFSLPVYAWLKKNLKEFAGVSVTRSLIALHFPRLVFLTTILALSILKISASTYNPFIYFRF